MPKVMMLSGVPLAGAYRPPPGRVLNGLGGLGAQIAQVRYPYGGQVPSFQSMQLGSVRRALGRAGLGDMCTDDGWAAVNALMTGVGSGIQAGATQTRDGVTTTDYGWAAVGTGARSTAEAWRQICAARGAQGSTVDPTAGMAAQQQQMIEFYRQQALMNTRSSAPAPAPAAGADKTWTYVGIGVGAVAVLGVWLVFGGRRRRR